jgi:hypothetical protein
MPIAQTLYCIGCSVIGGLQGYMIFRLPYQKGEKIFGVCLAGGIGSLHSFLLEGLGSVQAGSIGNLH